jgi:uridylate kinase
MAKNGGIMRVILKVSGEQLGSDEYNFDLLRAEKVAEVLEALVGAGHKVACVMGGGNIVRGGKLHENGFTNQVIADQMGMLATVQNGLFLNEVLAQRGTIQARLFSNIPVESVAERFSYQRAMKYMEAGKAVLIAGGLGKPGFTTDTGVVAQAHELHCDMVIKTTKVDGIYDKDPNKHQDAVRIERLTHGEAVANTEINVMDNAAMALAGDKGISIGVCALEPSAVLALLGGDTGAGTIVS